MEPLSPPFLTAPSHRDFNQNIAGSPSWCLSRTTSIAILSILLLKTRRAKERSPHSKAEINVECEESTAHSSQKGPIAISAGVSNSLTPALLIFIYMCPCKPNAT